MNERKAYTVPIKIKNNGCIETIYIEPFNVITCKYLINDMYGLVKKYSVIKSVEKINVCKSVNEYIQSVYGISPRNTNSVDVICLVADIEYILLKMFQSIETYSFY